MKTYILEKLLRLFTSLITSALAISRLGLGGYGLYASFLLPIPIVLLLSSAGVRNRVRTVSLDDSTSNAEYALAFFTELLISAFLSILLFIYYYFIIHSIPLALLLTFIAALAAFFNCFELEEVVFIVRRRIRLLGFLSFSQLVLSLLIKLFVLLSIPSAFNLLSTQVADQFLYAFLLASFSPASSKLLSSFRTLTPATIISELPAYIKQSFLALVVEAQIVLQSRSDQFILVYIFSPSVYGLYSLASRFIDLQRYFQSQLNTYFLPVASDLHSINLQKRILLRRFSILVLSSSLLLPLSVALLYVFYQSTNFTVLPVSNPNYSALFLCLALFLLPFYSFGHTLSLLQRNRLPAQYSACVYAIYLFILYILSTSFGFFGALISLNLFLFFQVVPYLRVIKSVVTDIFSD